MKNMKIGLVIAAFCGLILTVKAVAQKTAKATKPKIQTAKVVINEQGYAPASFSLRKGVPARVTFLRTTDRTCGTEIVIPAFGINRPLPLFQKVTVSFTPKKSGEFGFTCGMDMMRGKLIVR